MADERSVPWRRLGVEMFAIVASVLLALAANEWWEGREDRQRAREAVVQFRAELRANRGAVAEAFSYHRDARERIAGLVERVSRGGDYDPREEGPPMPRGFQPPVPRSTAWRTATTTGALQELPYGTVTHVSDAYIMQEVLDRQFDRILAGFMQPETFRAERSAPLLRFLLVSLNDIVSVEQNVLEAYDRALARLAEEPPEPSPSGSTPGGDGTVGGAGEASGGALDSTPPTP